MGALGGEPRKADFIERQGLPCATQARALVPANLYYVLMPGKGPGEADKKPPCSSTVLAGTDFGGLPLTLFLQRPCLSAKKDVRRLMAAHCHTFDR